MNYRRALLYALGVWVIPFVVAIAIFPLRANERPLFESIMPIAVVGATAIFAIRYLLMFSWGPMKMGFVDYLKDIGVTYLIIPVVTYGMSRVAPQRR